MDAPLFPEQRDDGQPEQRPWYLPRPQVLSVIAGLIALAGALIGLIARVEAIDGPYVPRSAAFPPAVIWGDPIGKGVVCVDELRANPTGGRWRCLASQRTDNGDPKYPMVGRKAIGDLTPCTHRRIGATNTWDCLTTVRPSRFVLRPRSAQLHDPVFFADLTQRRRTTAPPGGDLCIEETRPKPSAAWQCLTRERLPEEPYRLVQVIDPGGRCSYRVVDELSGVWSCKSTRPIATGR